MPQGRLTQGFGTPAPALALPQMGSRTTNTVAIEHPDCHRTTSRQGWLITTGKQTAQGQLRSSATLPLATGHPHCPTTIAQQA